jgi:hypothetical protein
MCKFPVALVVPQTSAPRRNNSRVLESQQVLNIGPLLFSWVSHSSIFRSLSLDLTFSDFSTRMVVFLSDLIAGGHTPESTIPMLFIQIELLPTTEQWVSILLRGSLFQVLECVPASLNRHASSHHVIAEVAEVDPIVGYANKPHARCNAVSHLSNNLVSCPTHAKNELLHPTVSATPMLRQTACIPARPGPAPEILSATPSQDNTVTCRERVPSASSPRSARHPS